MEVENRIHIDAAGDVVSVERVDRGQENTHSILRKHSRLDGGVLWEVKFEKAGSAYDVVPSSALDANGNLLIVGVSIGRVNQTAWPLNSDFSPFEDPTEDESLVIGK